MQNFKFTRNCLLRGLFGCWLLGCFLGCGFRRSLRGRLLRGLLLRSRGQGGLGSCTDRSRRLLLSYGNDDVCKPALVAESTSHWGRANTLHARTLVRNCGADVKIVYIDVQALLLRDVGSVLNRRTQDLFDHWRHALGAEVNGVERLLDAEALDHIKNKLRLLRAGALEPRLGTELSDFFYCYLSHNLRPSNFCFAAPCGGLAGIRKQPDLFGLCGGLSGTRGVALEGPGGREFTELVADHVLRHINRNKFTAVVDGDGVADKVRVNG